MLGHRGSYVSRLGDKISGGFSRLGHKVSEGTRAGVKWGIKHSGEIADISQKIEYGAEAVAKGAEMALPFTAEIPLVGEAVAGTAGLAEGVGALAGYVGVGATAVSKAKEKGLIPKSYGG